jgi:hypothetical protein
MHDSLKQFAEFFEVVKQPPVQYYVYYNPENGSIDKIQTHQQATGEYIVLDDANSYIQSILTAKSSENDYIVAFDKEQDTKGLFKKDTFLRKLHSNNDNLYGIPFKAEADFKDQINLNFHLSTQRLEIAVNRSALENLLKAVHTEKIHLQTSEKIVFYITDKYDPNLIHDTIVCDPDALLNSRLNFKLDWLTEEKLNRIIIWTKRFFHSYSWSWQAVQYVTPVANGDIYSINNGHCSASPDCHLRLQFTNNGVIITSNLKDPANVKFYDELACHVIKGNDPSQYYGTFSIPPDKVANGQTYTIDYVKPIDDLGIIFNNTNIRLHWTTE